MFPTKLLSSKEQSSPANPARQTQWARFVLRSVKFPLWLKWVESSRVEQCPLTFALLGVLPQESGQSGTEQAAPP